MFTHKAADTVKADPIAELAIEIGRVEKLFADEVKVDPKLALRHQSIECWNKWQQSTKEAAHFREQGYENIARLWDERVSARLMQLKHIEALLDPKHEAERVIRDRAEKRTAVA